MPINTPAITLDSLLARARASHNTKVHEHNAMSTELRELGEKHRRSDADNSRVDELRTKRAMLDSEIQRLSEELTVLEREKADDDRLTEMAKRTTPTGAGTSTERAGNDVTTDPAGARGQHAAARGSWVHARTGEPAVVERGARTIEHAVVRRFADQRRAADENVIGQHGSLGQLVRALTTSSGSAIVPTVWAADLIDLARAKAAVMAAGARLIPMDAKRVEIGRLTGDPTASFRTEGSTITPSDPTFDNVTLEAKTLSALVVGTMEWFQDADNADSVVTEAIATAIAQRIDLAALYGGITTDHGAVDLATPPNPRGVLAALNALAATNVLGGATNGTTQTTGQIWDEIIDLLFTVRDHNEEPTGLIWNSKLARQYAKAYDTTGQPLAVPAAVTAVPQHVSNQIPSYTRGTMTDRATDIFVGDWTQLLIGQRLDITIQVLTEKYADEGKIGIVAHWRGDIQPTRARAFAAYTAIQGAR